MTGCWPVIGKRQQPRKMPGVVQISNIARLQSDRLYLVLLLTQKAE